MNIIKKIYHYTCRKKNICVNSIIIKKSHITIKKFKNKYNGKRCFIVGNGPSLLLEDLKKLENEICFGSHRIYNIFEETPWRPTFYCAQDNALINESFVDIQNIDLPYKFIAIIPSAKYKKIKGAWCIKLINKPFYPKLPEFSADPTFGLYEGYTVTYMCIQLAVYMGFKQIYLLGIDHNYSITIDENGNFIQADNLKDHFSKNDKITNIPQLYKSKLAYKQANQYANTHGIKIYNVTRGGKLEEFERLDFDELMRRKRR